MDDRFEVLASKVFIAIQLIIPRLALIWWDIIWLLKVIVLNESFQCFIVCVPFLDSDGGSEFHLFFVFLARKYMCASIKLFL